jgi:hypothetical protein
LDHPIHPLYAVLSRLVGIFGGVRVGGLRMADQSSYLVHIAFGAVSFGGGLGFCLKMVMECYKFVIVGFGMRGWGFKTIQVINAIIAVFLGSFWNYFEHHNHFILTFACQMILSCRLGFVGRHTNPYSPASAIFERFGLFQTGYCSVNF